MKAADVPLKLPLPFANSGTKNTIPVNSQIGIVNGAASLTDGFPPLTFTEIAAGGQPPFGADFNGILYEISANTRWENAGGFYKYDSSFSTSVGGYPKGAVVLNSTATGFWLCTADDNTTDPDSGSSANWIAFGKGPVPLFSDLATTPGVLNQIVSTTGNTTAGIGSQKFILKSGTKSAGGDGWSYNTSGTTGFYWAVTDDGYSSHDVFLSYPSFSFGDTVNQNFKNQNNGAQGALRNTPSILILGDSITEGTGAASFVTGYSYSVARSVMNAMDNGFDNDRGYGYHTTINMANFITEPGVATTGSISATGVVVNRISLATTQTITITGRAVVSADAIYDASASTGSLLIKLNGNTVNTVAMSGTGLKNTFQTMLNGGAAISESDTITFQASGGTIVITGIFTLKSSNNSPLMYIVGKAGYAYQDYTGGAAITEIAYYLNFQRTSNEKILIVNLGTNNMYNSGKALSPANVVAQMTSLVSQINALCTTVTYVFSIPPKANESTWPQQAGYTYNDYASAIATFCYANNYQMIRNDKSILSRTSAYYSDGIHPNTVGHRIMAETVCDVVGVTYNPYLRTTAPAPIPSYYTTRADATYNSTWRAYTNNTAFKAQAQKIGNIVTLDGIIEPNGSVSTTCVVLPAGYRPNRTVFIVGRSDAGPVGLSIDTSGDVILLAVPTTWFSLEGICFNLVKS